MGTAEIRRRPLEHVEAARHTSVPLAPLLMDDPDLPFVDAASGAVVESVRESVRR